MNEVVEKILITEDQIINKSKELGEIISRDYCGDVPILIGLLKGSVPFLSELIRHTSIDLEIDFMDVSSYKGTESTEVRIIKDLEKPITNRKVLIVEDIVDTGKTYQKVKELLLAKGAMEVKIVTLLDKKARREVEVNVDYIGFEIPDEFVIGFGLDYNEKYRNLPFVGVIKKSVL